MQFLLIQHWKQPKASSMVQLLQRQMRQRHSLVLQAVHLMKIRHLPIMHQLVSMSATWHPVPLHSVQVCRQDALLPDSMVKMFPQWKTFRN